MILIVLDPNDYSATNHTIQDHTSLIWTERYGPCGDFELHTENIEGTMFLMPIGSLVSEVGTKEVMFVESHEISTDGEGKTTLVVKGRSFETFFENRVARRGDLLELHAAGGDVSNDWNVTGSSADVIGRLIDEAALNYSGTVEAALQAIPNYDYIQGSTLAALNLVSTNKYTIELGTTYDRILDMLAIDNLGIRQERQLYFGGGGLYTVVYGYVDQRDRVVFSTAAGHFQDASYVFSNVDNKNVMLGFSYYKTYNAVQNNSLTGIQRRIGYIDASDIKSASPYSGDAAAIRLRDQTELSKHRTISAFTGTFASTLPYSRGVNSSAGSINYNLGSIVTIQGDYGVTLAAMITEFTRSEDENGYKEYPSFVQV